MNNEQEKAERGDAICPANTESEKPCDPPAGSEGAAQSEPGSCADKKLLEQIADLTRDKELLVEALVRLRDCDFVITLRDRMDAVRKIAGEAIEADWTFSRKHGVALKPSRDKELLEQLVSQQAEDDGLWFVAVTAAEAYLQQELRKLHAAIENYENV